MHYAANDLCEGTLVFPLRLLMFSTVAYILASCLDCCPKASGENYTSMEGISASRSVSFLFQQT